MKMEIQWPVWPKYSKVHEEAVLRVIRSNQLYAAHEVAAFEEEFSSYVGSARAVGVGNATQGLHIALAALGIGPGDEVIVTPYSWISSASCVLMQNAIPVFVDIETESFGISPAELQRAITNRTRAVVLVHMFGLASQVEQIKEICDYYRIALIEDSSHSHGARLHGRHLGTFGDIGVFSLHQRKAISTGDGGVIVTNQQDIYERLRRLRSFGADQLSYNYRMNEFSASLGRTGLRELDSDNEIRKHNHNLLSKGIQCHSARVIEPGPGVDGVFYSNLIDIAAPIEHQQSILHFVNSLGVPLKRTWQPLHKHPHFSRENMVKKIAPWDSIKEQYQEPSELYLANSEEFQTRRLFELDCHPLVPADLVAEAAKIIQSAVNDAS